MTEIVAQGFLEWTPQPKGRPRFARATGRAYTPAKTASAERLVADWLMTMRFSDDYRRPLRGPIVIEVHSYMPIPASWSKAKKDTANAGKLKHTSRPDIDNLAKLVLDAANGVLWEDDSQIVSMKLTKEYSVKPGTFICIWSAE